MDATDHRKLLDCDKIIFSVGKDGSVQVRCHLPV